MSHASACAQRMSVQLCEKIRGVRVFCPHLPVGYSGSLSAVHETNCNKKEIRAKKKGELTSNSIRRSTTTRNLEMKANIAILYVGQLERWTSNLQRKLRVLVVCVCVDLNGWALQLVLLICGVSDFSRDSGSVIRSKLQKPIFACFVQSKVPLSFVSSLFLWSEFVCMVFFCRFIPLFALLF